MTRPVLLNNLALGSTFTFVNDPTAPVYVRARGGYRPGRGGPLVRHSQDQHVYRYSGLHELQHRLSQVFKP